MKTIVLFSRCELVHLYGRMHSALSQKYKIIHLAYSAEEETILKEKYEISEVINFKKEVSYIHLNEKIDIKLCNFIDELIINQSKERFNLNSAIQSDRTYQRLDYSECLILCQTYYKFWDSFISINKVDFILHEPNSLYLNQIASILCNNYNAKFITQIQAYGEDEINYLIVSADNCFCDELNINKVNVLTLEENEHVDHFLNILRTSIVTFFSSYTKKRTTFFKLIQDSLSIFLITFKNKIKFKSNNLSSFNHLDLFLLQNKSFLSQIRLRWESYFLLKYDQLDNSNIFYYYPIHLEPEAVVLYWGDGIYKNQVKLIENIAAQLPPNCYLCVKDHPHAGAYREYADYKKIQAIPNVKLLNPAVPGKSIIKLSKGVITINGTSGFEALLLNKQVYTFGNCFYNQCSRVHQIKNIKDLRHILYENFNITYEDDEILQNFVSAYLKSTHSGFTDYFLNYAKLLGVNEEMNAEVVANGLSDYFDKCK